MENTNKAIFTNTIIMYTRLAIVAVAGLFTTRFALNALGITDFGLFSVVGGIISFAAILNTIMVSTTTRFIAVAIGKGEERAINDIFNVNLLIHVVIAILTICIVFPVGGWYIENYVNFDGDIDLAVKVFNITIIGTIVSFIGVPYHGMLMAKEKFFVFCFADVIFCLIKMLGAFLLQYYFVDKLTIYSLIIAFCTGAPTMFYMLYCHKTWPNLTKWRMVKERKLYKEIATFTGWMSYGVVASITESQSRSLLVNAFFNTVMNASLGVANTINSFIVMFSQNVTKSIAPQITKSYAIGDHERCKSLMAMSSKFSFFVIAIISVPFLLITEYVYTLWLGSVPEYAVMFVRLMIIQSLICTFNAGISDAIFASGNVKLYQNVLNTNLLLSIPIAYFVLKSGAPAYYLLYVSIAVQTLNVFVRQLIMHKTLKYDNMFLIKQSYLPSILVIVLFLPFTLLNLSWHPIIEVLVAELYLCALIFFVGLSKSERYTIINKVARYEK